MQKGKIIQIIGPVVDVEFPEDSKLPAIFNALKISWSVTVIETFLPILCPTFIFISLEPSSSLGLVKTYALPLCKLFSLFIIL